MESKNIFEYRYADNKLDRLPSLADELVGLKVDLILAASAMLPKPPRMRLGRFPLFL